VTGIRRGTPADEAAILVLAGELAAFPVPAWRTAEEIQRADDGVIRDALGGAPGMAAFVADGAPGIEGVACVATHTDYFTRERVAHVEVLAVDPRARGRGVARALMDAAESWARGEGMRRITLNVWTQNERARGLYEHLGYAPETMHYLKEL
jgi:ribosomal protein S18 acetylase RimI-like enzyme